MLELDEWQLTELGSRSIQWDRSLVEFMPFFERRRVPIEQYSFWELIDLLEEEHCSLVQYAPRITPPALRIKGAIKPDWKKIYFFGNKLDLQRSYLESLATTAALRSREFLEIKHKARNEYYDALFGRYVDEGFKRLG